MPALFCRFQWMLFALLAVLSVGVSPAQEASKAEDKEKEKGQEVERPDKSPSFAFVCVNSFDSPRSNVLKSKVVEWLKLDGLDALKKFRITRQEQATVIKFEVGERDVTIAHVNSPIPKDDIEYAADNSTHWPDAAAKLAGHKSHLNITVTGTFRDAGDLALFLSKVVAACTETYDAAGVYWGHATLVHSPEFFREKIREATPEKLPVFAWVAFIRSKGKEEGTYDLFTRGLDVFGVMEVEVIGTKYEPVAVKAMVSELSGFLLNNGNVIKDGHTIDSPSGKVRTSHANSALGREGKVLRIEF